METDTSQRDHYGDFLGMKTLFREKSERKNEKCNSLLRRLLIRCLSAFIGLILLIKITFLLKRNIMDQKCQIYLVDPWQRRGRPGNCKFLLQSARNINRPRKSSIFAQLSRSFCQKCRILRFSWKGFFVMQ